MIMRGGRCEKKESFLAEEDNRCFFLGDADSDRLEAAFDVGYWFLYHVSRVGKT
jgi:hypothetical protein